MLAVGVAVSKMFNPKKQNKVPPSRDTLLQLPAHKLSQQIKDGSLTSARACEIYIERVKQVQPFINAMAQERFSEALDEARAIDELLASLRQGKPESEFTADELEMLQSPLLGVPVSVKESIMVKGMKNSCGLVERKNTVANRDAVAVRNVRRLGLVPICTTNIPEGTLFWADCQNKVYGRCLNPYDLSRVSGASSGGEGALLASCGSIVGIGTDMGGSLRIPAHFCGINSHKPSPFLVSPEGNFPELKESRLRLFTLGPMCRYASDLRHLLKCLISDKDNAKQDTYYKFQPKDITEIRKKIIDELDEQKTDLSQLSFYYFDFNSSSQLRGKQSVRVNCEFMAAQQELIEHFHSKFNCKVAHLNLDGFFKKILLIWQAMLKCGGCVDRDTTYDARELHDFFGIDSIYTELLKMSLGISKHTKESIVSLLLGNAIPYDKEKAFPLCEKFEKIASEIKEEIENTLGDKGILIMPTLPCTAYKHNVSLLKTADFRFPALFNVLQLPVTHVTMRLDKKHKMPFGFSIASRQYNDPLTLAVAEEVELTFGGWIPPFEAPNAVDSAQPSTVNAGVLDEKLPVNTQVEAV